MASSHNCVMLALGVGVVTGDEVDDGELDPLLTVLLLDGVGVELALICTEDGTGETTKF
jgi:hypothetical protein